MSLHTDAEKLLEGEVWETAVADDGRTYFYQPFTAETRWTLPDAVQRRVDTKIREHLREVRKAEQERALKQARRNAKQQKQEFFAGKTKEDKQAVEELVETIAKIGAELKALDKPEPPEPEPEPEPESSGKRLPPFYAYSGCKRCLDLAEEIDRQRQKLHAVESFLRTLSGPAELAERFEQAVAAAGERVAQKTEARLLRAEAARDSLAERHRLQEVRIAFLEAQVLGLGGAVAPST